MNITHAFGGGGPKGRRCSPFFDLKSWAPRGCACATNPPQAVTVQAWVARGKYLDSLQLGVQGPGPACVLTRSLKGSGGSGGCGAFSGSRPDSPMVGGHFPGGRKRISLSCERLRALLPQFDGRREDMASVLEMSVQFLRLASTLVPGWEKHAVSCPAAALSALWGGAVGIPHAPGSSGHPAAWLPSALRLALPGLLRFCRHASVCAQHLLREPRGQAVFSSYVLCTFAHGAKAGMGKRPIAVRSPGGHGLQPPSRPHPPVLRTRSALREDLWGPRQGGQ